MRKTNNIQTNLIKVAIIIACAILVLIYNNSQAAGSFAKTHVCFTQLSNNDISLTVKTSTATQIQFYLFTVDGKLVKNFETINSLVTLIKNPGTGIYLYQCFENDKELKNGKLILEKNKLKYD